MNPEERTLLEWLLANGVPEARQYVQQLTALRVVGRCSCGCPSVDFASGILDPAEATKILADFIGKTSEGIEVGVILWMRQKQISELEVYSLGITDTNGGIFGLPTIESLKAFPQPPK